MTETGLFIAGAFVSIIVFAGGFVYAAFSFGRWPARDAAADAAKVESTPI